VQMLALFYNLHSERCEESPIENKKFLAEAEKALNIITER